MFTEWVNEKILNGKKEEELGYFKLTEYTVAKYFCFDFGTCCRIALEFGLKLFWESRVCAKARCYKVSFSQRSQQCCRLHVYLFITTYKGINEDKTNGDAFSN